MAVEFAEDSGHRTPHLNFMGHAAGVTCAGVTAGSNELLSHLSAQTALQNLIISAGCNETLCASEGNLGNMQHAMQEPISRGAIASDKGSCDIA